VAAGRDQLLGLGVAWVEHQHGGVDVAQHAHRRARHRQAGPGGDATGGHGQHRDVVAACHVADELVARFAVERVVVGVLGVRQVVRQPGEVVRVRGVRRHVGQAHLQQAQSQAELVRDGDGRREDRLGAGRAVECDGEDVGVTTDLRVRADHHDRHLGVTDQVGAHAAEEQLSERRAAVATDTPEGVGAGEHRLDELALDVLVLALEDSIGGIELLLGCEGRERGSCHLGIAGRGDGDELEGGRRSVGEPAPVVDGCDRDFREVDGDDHMLDRHDHSVRRPPAAHRAERPRFQGRRATRSGRGDRRAGAVSRRGPGARAASARCGSGACSTGATGS
jgi:hypothetical protein